MRSRSVSILVLLFILSLAVPAGARTSASPDILQGALKEILRQVAEQPDLRVAGEPVFLPDLLERFYRERSYRPLWSTIDRPGRDRIRAALHYLGTSRANGLCDADYHLPFFRELLTHFTIGEDDILLPRLRWSGWYDVLLTDALFHYARHLLEGRVPPDAVQEGWNLRKPKVDLVKVVNFAFANDELDKVLHDMQPVHRDYLALQIALDRYREIEAFGGWPAIPDGEAVFPGQADPRIPLLRTRLLLSGDLVDLPSADSLRLDAADVAALKRFQRRHGLEPDGVLGARTRSALNVPVGERVRQIELNLERWRWLPKETGRRYLLVNIADFSVSLVDAGRTVLAMPVVVGNSYRKTPVFSARLEYVEFAPYWYVPKTILSEDKLPRIRRDPGYLERNHFEIVSWDRTRIIDPETIPWHELDGENFPGLLRQKPGPWNALGRVKFMLPNEYAIYLHDTNERNHFGERHRTFSSGCIRLARPDELALKLLEAEGWDADAVARALERDRPKQAWLKNPLPVHVLYWTAWVDDTGRVHFREDIYGRDRDLWQALERVSSGCAGRSGDDDPALARSSTAATRSVAASPGAD